jgi:hypothetical protein
MRGILRGHMPDTSKEVKRWSDLHGDVESWAENGNDPAPAKRRGNNNA